VISLNSELGIGERQRAAHDQVYNPTLQKSAIAGLRQAVDTKQEGLDHLCKRVDEDAMRKALQALKKVENIQNDNIRIEDPFQPIFKPVARQAVDGEGWKTHATQMGGGL